MCGACGKKYSNPRAANRSASQALMQPVRQLSVGRRAPVVQQAQPKSTTARPVTANMNTPKTTLLKPPV